MTLRPALTPIAALAAVLLTGCSATLKSGFTSTSNSPIQGTVHGGQQPISGATIQLYAAGSGGYASAATPLLSTTVTTKSDGSFSISGDYSCSSANQVYLTASGGNPGGGSNTNHSSIVLMAALGSCANLLANANTTFISLNEVTTVAGAWALAPFMASPSNLATSSTNAVGLVNAFAAANKIANTATGYAPGPALPSGATLPIAEVNTLADILAACVNSTGSGPGGDPCVTLFAAATPPNNVGLAPTDTLTAALNIAHYPSQNVTALFNLTPSAPPFMPVLNTAPNNWLIGIHYIGGGLSQPSAVAVDGTGNVWVANQGNSTVSEFASSGAPLSPAGGYTGGGLSGPSSLALDETGNAWVANSLGNSVTRIGPLGSSFASFTGGGINIPSGIAIDGYGNIFVANKNTSSVTELSSSGAVLSTTPYTGGGINKPTGIVINAQ